MLKYKKNFLFFCIVTGALSACSASNTDTSYTYTYTPKSYDNDSYCYNGGRSNKYSCDPKLASPQPNMHAKEIDELWMYMTLIDIKAWLKEQRLLAEQQQ